MTYITITAFVLSLMAVNPGSGFKSLTDPEDRTCIEEDVCHDISDYKRKTEGEAYPYEHCICHGELPDPSLVVVVEGPRSVEPGSRTTYTARILGGPGVVYGYGINTTNGSLSKNFQFNPRDFNEFQVEFEAPEEPQKVYLTFVGLSADGDNLALPETNQTGGDSWNLNRIPVDVVSAETEDDGGPSSISIMQVIIVVFVAALIVILALIFRISSKKRKKD